MAANGNQRTTPPRVKAMRKANGVEYRYYRHPDGRLSPLPARVPYSSDEFLRAYRLAEADTAEGRPATPKAPSLRDQNNLRYRFETGIARALLRAKRRSAENKRGCTVDAEYLLEILKRQKFLCSVSGLPFIAEEGDAHPYSLSIDRIDHRKGYVAGNVRLVLYAVNVALNTWGDDVFYTICAASAIRRLSRSA